MQIQQTLKHNTKKLLHVYSNQKVFFSEKLLKTTVSVNKTAFEPLNVHLNIVVDNQ